ncbi:uncharacterized protein BCR38DRAFT_482557 [Pseudomassariella vexata]|uniref:Zn(2)-C6 fungal-type domain-containing protein n=1 Tax=Pseudomassariella vexata TaxID=1141098 RepID=A0A1Y2EE60_9PEZI|nr:uncharacterized protein BCR38DRAFT_482557 [Pseudomassariella vexata]ORY69085.1 hypothetical protein BCR38DRAFT_482557 [Pseudomassariella vexata]
MSDESGGTASIACEPCRQKKCKCDRKLPICTQCTATAAKCNYPEQNRRGIPAGYLNMLEKRLVETERALFFALAEIHAGIVDNDEYPNAALLATRPSTKSKSEMMAAWAKQPLGSRERAKSWFLENRDGAVDAFRNPFNGRSFRESGHSPSQFSNVSASPGPEPWASGSVGMAPPQVQVSSTHYLSGQQHDFITSTSNNQGIQRDMWPSSSDNIVVHMMPNPSVSELPVQRNHMGTDGNSRASALAREHKRMYF